MKFYILYLILTVLLYGISNGHTKYGFQILSYTWDIALRNLPTVNKAQALLFKNMAYTRKDHFKTKLDVTNARHRLFVFKTCKSET
jgi:hypothetical protein